MNADRPPLADTGGLTDADSQSIAWLRAHVCFLVALLSFGGAGLLIASEITDRLERVEGDLEPTALNLAIATVGRARCGNEKCGHADEREGYALGKRPGGAVRERIAEHDDPAEDVDDGDGHSGERGD